MGVPDSNGRSSSVSTSFGVPTQPATTPLATQTEPTFTPTPSRANPKKRWVVPGKVILGIIGILVVVIVGVLLWRLFNPNTEGVNSETGEHRAGAFGPIEIPLEEISQTGQLIGINRSLSINGQLKVSNSITLSPGERPATAAAGQIYYDKNTNLLNYYNGSGYVELSTNPQTVTSIGGSSGAITLAGGLSLNGNVLSAQSGVVSITSASANLSVTNDGAGNITLGNANSSNATTGRIAVFTDGGGLANSILSQSGDLVTIDGNLSLGSTLSLQSSGLSNINLADNVSGVVGQIYNDGNLHVTGGQNNLWLEAGGSGTIFLNAANGNPVAINQATPANYPLEVNGDINITAGNSLRINGTVICDINGCAGGGGSGVASLNSLTGALNIANATAAGSTVTIDDASTSQKGIARFNSTNFSVTSGIVNTIQNIAASASPTFAAINTNTITPSGALTVGLVNQNLTLQGANTILSSTNSGNTTALSFVAPTANVTYRLQTAAAGTYDVCTTAGNCVGVGGSVTTPGGTTNRVAKFTGSNAIGDSLISDNGTVVTINGNLSVTGTVTLTTPLAVTQGGTGANTAAGARTSLGAAASGANSDITSLTGLTTALSIVQGGTGATSLTANGVLLGNGTSPISSLVASGGGECLVSTAGAPVWQACPGSGGVTSLNGLTGVLTIANASGVGSTITLNDATTSTKGIASFNSTNFSVTSGAVNTIQNINTGATPTFAGINTNSITPSGALTVGATTQNATLQGATTTITSTASGNTAALTFVAPTANVTYRLQTAAAGTYDVCTTAGNCVGVGGSVTTSGGTTNRLAKFTGSNAIGDSLISDNGTLVTVNGDLTVTGAVTLTTPLAVTEGGTGANTAAGARTNLGAAASGANSDITSLSGLTTALSIVQGGTGATSLTANGVLLGNGTSPISSLVAVSANQCLISTVGAPVWQSCPGSGGVSSVNGLTGALTIANASGVGSTITLNDATTSTKGIASFNSTNFSVTSGAVNTIQDIAVSSAPTFGRLTVTSSQASNGMLLVNNTNASGSGNLIDLQLNGSSRFAVSPAGAMTLSSTINGQTISSSANFTGTLGVTGAASLNGGATVTGTLTANTITPSSSLTVGATNQSFVMQGNASSTITATNGANTTTVAFQSPTASVTYRLLTAAAGTYDICTTVGNCSGVGGGVTTPGGTTNQIAKFTASGTIGDSIISDNGTTVTVGGTLAVNTITPGAAMTIGAISQNLTLQGAVTRLTATNGGITNTLTFATPGSTNKTITLPNASGTVAVSATGPLSIDSAGNISCPSCVTSGGGGGGASAVDSLNGLTGALSIANASGSGATITIDDASASAKGIASFNSTNFSVTSGAVNTIQNINSTAAPTFGQLTLTSSQASAAMLVVNNTNVSASGNLLDLQLNGASRLAVTPAGAMTIASTINGQTISSSASFTGTLAVSGAANLNGGATVTGTLTANTITPSSSLTVGATSQSFLVQGSSGSTITATNGANTTTLAFQSPTASVTYRFLTAAAGTYDVCTTVGNCAGVGGGVTTPGGTSGKIAKFTGTGSIGDSIITESGSTISVAGTVAATTALQTPLLDTASAGALNIGTTNATAINLNQNTNVTGNLDVSGTLAVGTGDAFQVNASGNVTTSGNGTFNGGSLSVGTASQAGTVTIYDGSSNTATLQLANLSVNRAITFGDEAGTVCLQSSTNCGFAPSSGSANYIQNQNGADQASANFRISGTGRANTSITTPLLDSITGALNIGTTNATAINLNKATAVTGALTQSGGTFSLASSASGSITASGSLTLTASGGSTWSTSAGNLTIQAATTNNLTLQTGGAGLVALGDQNTTTINIGRGSNIARTITIGDTGGGSSAQTLSVGNSGASSATTISGGAGITLNAGSNSWSLQGGASSSLSATGGGFTTTIGFTGTPTGAVLYQFDRAATAGTYQICTTAGNCSGGANTALSNLSAVAINTSLLPGAAGAIDLGSGTLPLRDLYVAGSSGTPGTNNFKITGASTSGTRTITLPDATGTVCLQSSASCNFAASSGSANYIQNGTSLQTANMAIQSASSSSIAAVIKGAASQSVSTFQVQNSGGTALLSVGPTNDSLFNTNLAIYGQGSSGDIALKVVANSSQSGTNLIADFRQTDTSGASVARLTYNGGLYIGNGTGIAGTVNLASSSGSFAFINTATLSTDRTITLPNSSGTVCLDSGNCTGSTLQTAYNASTGGTTPEIKLDTTRFGVDIQDADSTMGGSQNFLSMRASNGAGLGAIVFGWGLQGTYFQKPTTNSTTAFQIQNATSNNVFTVDSTNGRVGINLAGSANPAYSLEVKGDVNVGTGVYRSGGTAGLTSTTCSGGQVLQNIVVTGGIVTGGTCVSHVASTGLTDCDASNSKLLWDSTTSSFSCGTDRASAGVRKPSDESINADTNVQNDDNFSFSIGANETWAFQIFADIKSSTGGGFKSGISAPAGANCRYSASNLYSNSNYTTSSCNDPGVNNHSDSQDQQYVFYGTVANGATAGTVNWQWAQATSSGTTTFVREGSQMIAYKLSGADVAEAYYTQDKTMAPGDVVQVDSSLPAGVKKSTGAYSQSTIGVVSTDPGVVLGHPKDALSTTGRPVLLALNGRVPVKVSDENGPVHAGDYLTASSKPGIAMKATKPGQIIGTAIDDAGANSPSGISLVTVFVNPGWASPTTGGLQLAAQETDLQGQQSTMFDKGVDVKGKLTIADTFTVDPDAHRITVGPAAGDANGTILVLGNKTTAGDPEGANGAMYYNAATTKFRCFEGNAWKDCITDTMPWSVTVFSSDKGLTDCTLTATVRTLGNCSGGADSRFVTKTDLANARAARVVASGYDAFGGGAIKLQYSRDGQTWKYLDASSGPSQGTEASPNTSEWANLAADAKGDVWIRAVVSGSGTLSSLTNVTAQFK